MVQLSHLYVTTGKSIALTRWTYAVQVCHSFPSKEQVSSNFMAAVTTLAMILGFVLVFFLMLNFKPAFSLSSSSLIKWLMRSSLLSPTRVVLSSYLRLFIFPPAILIPACDSSSLAFHMIYSAYKFNKSNNIQPC